MDSPKQSGRSGTSHHHTSAARQFPAVSPPTRPKFPPETAQFSSGAPRRRRVVGSLPSRAGSERGRRGGHVFLGRRRVRGGVRGRGGDHGRGAAEAGLAQREGRAGDPPLRDAPRLPRPRADPAPRASSAASLLAVPPPLPLLLPQGLMRIRSRHAARRRRWTTSPTPASTTWWSRSTRWTSTARSSSCAPTFVSACRRLVASKLDPLKGGQF